MCGRLKNIPNFKLKSLLNPGGQILLDSLILSICLMMMKMEGNGFHPIMNIIGGEEANIALQKKRTNL
jgi:hypothetical protein